MGKLISFCILLLYTFPAWAQNSLDFYVDRAKQNSALIFDNKNQSRANQLEAERLKAQYSKLQVSITANYLFSPIINRDNNQSKLDLNPGAADNYSGYDLAASNGGTYQSMLNITQPLFSKGRSDIYAEQSVIASQISQNLVRISEHDMEKLVGDQYILCLQDIRQWQFADSLLVILNEQQQVLRKLSESGLAKQSDLSLLTIEVQTQLNTRLTFLNTYKRDLLDLNVLCGIQDTTVSVLPDISLIMNADTTSSRYLTKYRLDSLNLVAQQKVFELKYKPLLSAFANGGLNAVYAPTIPNRFGFSAGLTLTWNLFDGHQKDINRQKVNTLLQSVSLYKDYFQHQNAVRKDRIITELKGINQRAKILEAQLKEYKTLLSFYKKELIQGQMPVINYINVLKTLSVQQRDYALLQANRQLLINLYNYWNW